MGLSRGSELKMRSASNRAVTTELWGIHKKNPVNSVQKYGSEGWKSALGDNHSDRLTMPFFVRKITINFYDTGPIAFQRDLAHRSIYKNTMRVRKRQ